MKQTVKHRVYREVLAGRLIIKGPKSFAEHARALLMGSIDVIYVENMDTSVDAESREKAQFVAGTLKVHKVVRTVNEIDTKLKFYYTSEDEEPFCTKVFGVSNRCFGVGCYVLVNYEGEKYPGKIISVDTTTATVDCMAKVGRSQEHWKWPAKKDCIDYLLEDIINGINEPAINVGLSTGRAIVHNVPEMLD